MSVTTIELTRIFRYNGEDLKDPAPGQPPEKAVELLAMAHPELNNAVVEPPETKNGRLIYPLKLNLGTKG